MGKALGQRKYLIFALALLGFCPYAWPETGELEDGVVGVR